MGIGGEGSLLHYRYTLVFCVLRGLTQGRKTRTSLSDRVSYCGLSKGRTERDPNRGWDVGVVVCRVGELMRFTDSGVESSSRNINVITGSLLKVDEKVLQI